MMKHLFKILLFCFFLINANSGFADASSPSPRDINFEWMALNSWYEMHAEDIKEAYKGEAELIFLGDSITQGWDWTIWQKYFAPLKAVNFGIGGDKTQNILWRLQHGDAGTLRPRLIVLMAGVNNFGHDNDSAEDVSKGVEAIIEEIELRFPTSKMLLLGILPYGEKSEVANRERVAKANNLLKTMSKEKNLYYQYYGDLFVNKDGEIPRELMGDLLHPTPKGYALIVEKLGPLVKELMEDESLVSFNNKNILIEGRSQLDEKGLLKIGYPGVGIHLHYSGKNLSLFASSSNGENLLDVYIDGKLNDTLKIGKSFSRYTLTNTDKKKDLHIELVHRSETWHGVLSLENLDLHGGHLLKPKPLPKRKLLFIGDSITCGEALNREKNCQKNFSWWDPQNSFGKLLGKELKAQSHLVCYGGRGLLRSWNGSRDDQQAPDFFNASLPLGPQSPQWLHSTYVPDFILIALGTNDFNLNIGPFPEEDEYVSTYLKFIENIQGQYPKATIALTDGPIVNNESDPQRAQKAVLQSYLEKIQKLSAGKVFYFPSAVYNGDECDAHPTAEQHQLMARDLKPQIEKVMGW